MTVSILNDILQLRDKPLSEWKRYFEITGVHIFDNIVNKFYVEEDSNTEARTKNTILFILCAYDEYSPMVVLRQDREDELNNICEYLQIPEFLRQDLIFAQDREVKHAITDYLRAFAGPLFCNYMFLRIQLADFQLMITNKSFGVVPNVKDKDDAPVEYQYDFKEHSKATMATELLAKKIAQLEEKMKQKEKLIGIQEMDNWKNPAQAKKTGGIGQRGNMENLVRDNTRT